MTDIRCVYSFTIVADSPEQQAEFLDAWRTRVEAASPKLGIGFAAGFLASEPEPFGDVPAQTSLPLPTADPEALFDDPV